MCVCVSVGVSEWVSVCVSECYGGGREMGEEGGVSVLAILIVNVRVCGERGIRGGERIISELISLLYSTYNVNTRPRADTLSTWS